MSDKTKIRIERLCLEHFDEAKKNCSLFRDMLGSDQSLKTFLQDKKNILIIAEINSEQVGQIIAHLLDRVDSRPPQLFLYSIDVTESWQKKGIGSKLINFLLNTAKHLNCSKCFVLTNESNLAAMKLYNKTGAEQLRKDDAFLVWNVDFTRSTI